MQAGAPTPGKRAVLVVGTFRSGTNLMKHMLETQYGVQVHFSTWFWKHGLPPTAPHTPLPDDVPVVVMTKAPVALNASLYAFWQARRPELDVGASLSEFIAKPFIVYDNTEGMQRPHYRFATPTEYWNQFHYTWTHWQAVAERVHFIQIERLLQDPTAQMRALEGPLGLVPARDATLSLPGGAVAPSMDQRATRLDQSYRPHAIPTLKDADAIRALVNPEVARRLGYCDRA